MVGDRLDRLFAGLAGTIGRHPWRWLGGVLVATALLTSQLPSIRIDTSVEGMLDPGSPAIADYLRFKHAFGTDQIFMVLVETDDAFAPDFVAELRRFHDDLYDRVPLVDRVDSLVNARHSYSVDGTLQIDELLADAPLDDPGALRVLRDYAYGNVAYQNYLLSSDRQLVCVMVRLLPFESIEDDDGNVSFRQLEEDDLARASHVVDTLIAEYVGSLSSDMQVAGGPRLQVSQGVIFEEDFGRLTGMANAIVGLLLWLVFRRAAGVFLPVVVMAFSALATFSTMALMETPMQLTSAILPCFLLAVCVGDSIHLLVEFFRGYDAGLGRAEALTHALEHTSPALFFTSLTTAAGLATFAASELFIVACLGTYAAVGVVFAYLYTMLLLPCLLMILPLARRPALARESTVFQRWVALCVGAATGRPVLIGSVALGLLVAGGYVALQLQFRNDTLEWLDAAHPTRRAIAKAQERLGGSIPLEVVIDTGSAGGGADPRLLQQLDDSLAEIASWREGPMRATKIIALPDVIKEIHQVLHDGDERHYVIPRSREAVRQELLLVEMDAPDSLFQLTDTDYRYLRTSVILPWGDSMYMQPFADRLARHFDEHYADYAVNVTGVGVLMSRAFVAMLYTTVRSYVLAVLAIGCLMILVMGDWRVGLISMIPNLLPIVMVLAMMNLLDMPLDVFTLMIGSIALGITVDDTVHFMHHFKRFYRERGAVEPAIRETLLHAGRAMTITTVALVSGFLIFTQSALSNLQDFGLITAVCLVLAWLADFVLAPALMVWAGRAGLLDSWVGGTV